MIWIVVAVIAMVLALVFVWALMRTAAMADLRAEQWKGRLLTYSDEPRVRISRLPYDIPYDHEEHGDFDDR